MEVGVFVEVIGFWDRVVCVRVVGELGCFFGRGFEN